MKLYSENNVAKRYLNQFELIKVIMGNIRTGYCRSTKKFVRVKLKSWDDYREIIPACPDCPEAILPIYDGGQVAEIPCPKCGNLTLHYKRINV